MKKIYDAIIIGSGAAGYAAADRLFCEGVTNIAVVTEGRLSGTSRNTGSDKQTYYKLAMDGCSEDSARKMALDICSGGSCDGEKAYIQAVNSQRCFLRLCEYGVKFPTDSFGGFPGYKTDHDSSMRATSAGPLTSKFMTQALEDVVLNKNATPLLDNLQVIKIVTEGIKDRRVCGIVALNRKTGQPESIFAKNIIVASGAPACIYERSVYPESQHGMTGVLISAGVRLCNFSQWQYGLASTDFRWNVSGSFMQVIPRFVSVGEDSDEREFLPEYAGSAEAANNLVFLKGYQWPFCSERTEGSSKIDLAVDEQIRNGRRVYLDYTKNPEGFAFSSLSDEALGYLENAGAEAETPIERLALLNPKAIAVYAGHGIDLRSQRLRIGVCAQHNNGGVYTDCDYQTNIEGLYVIGEAAGSFGLARPGGSALNDTQVGALVCARRIKNHISREINRDAVIDEEKRYAAKVSGFKTAPEVDYSYIPRKMSNFAAFIRDKEKCEALLGEITALLKTYPAKHRGIEQYFYDLDMLICARALLKTVLLEMPLTGSRGGAVFADGGKIVPENRKYREYLTITDGEEISFEKTSPVPLPDGAFEKYLAETEV
ncbi:MAG: FAD-binding protein [Clostridiales bacterium]|nr:FAD-binding protein [Clostridiales bacterium]